MERNAPAASEILWGYLLKASSMGEDLISCLVLSLELLAASSSLKASVSSSFNWIYILIITKTKLIKKGILQPQERKLSSEVIEGIDEGPLESIKSSGGSKLNELFFGVIPQVMPTITYIGCIDLKLI